LADNSTIYANEGENASTNYS